MYNLTSSNISLLSNNDISNRFKILRIVTTFCLREVKFVNRNLLLIFLPDKYNNKRAFTEEEGSKKILNAYSIHINP